MPTAYNTAGQITQLVRSLLNDASGNLFTDTVLIPYANAAYRKVQRALANVQSATFITDEVLLIVSAVSAADPSVQVAITDATPSPNQLPSDLLVPLKLWERQSGSSDDFVEMTDLTDHGGLPSQPQGMCLEYWEWRSDGLYFIGATQDTQIRLRYQKALPDLVDGTSPVLIRNAQEAITYFTAAMASASRGAPLAARWDAAGRGRAGGFADARHAARTAQLAPPPPVHIAPGLRPDCVTNVYKWRTGAGQLSWYNRRMASHSANPKQQAHELIERLAPGQVSAVVGLLEAMLDPVSRAIANAPADDEPESDGERQTVAESKDWFERHKGEGVSHEDVLADFNLTPNDLKHRKA